jgi:hypothetical protein
MADQKEVNEVKIRDWTGLADSCNDLQIGLTPDDTLFVGSKDQIHSIRFADIYTEEFEENNDDEEEHPQSF